MLAVVRAQQPWGLLPDPSSSFWPTAITGPAGSLSPAPLAAAVRSAPRSAVSARPAPTCPPIDAHYCASRPQRRNALKPLCATAGDGSDARGATMPAAAASKDESRGERLAAVRNLERAVDPAAAEAAELRRRHKEAVELARTGDPEMALACLHSLLVNDPIISRFAQHAFNLVGCGAVQSWQPFRPHHASLACSTAVLVVSLACMWCRRLRSRVY